MSRLDDLKKRATQIKDASTPGEVTATQVGGLMEDTIDYMGTINAGGGSSGGGGGGGIEIVNDITSGGVDKALSAEMGKALNLYKVDRVTGKGLSTEDYTTAEKAKLSNIENGAQVNPNVFNASGPIHSSGLVPDPGSTAGSTKYLCENGTWQVPSGGGGGGSSVTGVKGAGESTYRDGNVNLTPGNILDKSYNSSTFSGLGTVYLEKNITSNKNVLTQAMLSSSNTVYVVRHDYDLNAQTITIPSNCELVFDGGSIKNGALTGTNTRITANSNDVIFGTNIVIAGTWNVTEIYDTWFAYTENMVSNQLITNMLNMTTEDYQNKVLITRDTTYYVEFNPPAEWVVEHPLWKTDGLLNDGSGNYGNGSQTAADLVWYQDPQMPTTRSIALHLSQYYYPDPQNGSQNIYQQYFHDYGGIIWDPEVINRITLFFIKSNTHLVINSTIQMLDHKQTVYNMFHMMNKHNITIEGTGVIHGEITDNYDITYKWPVGSQVKADMYDGTWKLYYGEFGVLVNMLGASDVVIRDITLSGSSGDCLYINPCISECPNGSGTPNPPSITKNVLVENVKIDKARRNGIVCCGINVTLNDVLFSNCGIDTIGGTVPKSGIDFENDVLHPMIVQDLPDVKAIMETYYPDNYNAMGCFNVRMNNCKFENCFNDISATSTQVDQSQINSGDPSNLTPGAAIISNCNISRLRLNWTNSIRFRNCQIETITSYDATGAPEQRSKYVEYENCKFGDNVASSYFAYANNNYTWDAQKVTFEGCVGRTMYYGKDYVYYKSLGDGIINIRIPFNYDSRLDTGVSSFPYKINRGVVHVKIVSFTSEFSLRISECDITLHDWPNMFNAKYYGGTDNDLSHNAPYTNICSKPRVITDSVNHKQYISFYIAGGDVLDRYYDYSTHQFSGTASDVRPYDNKNVMVSFDYLGVPDERGNLTVSVQTGWTEEQLEGGVYSGVTILCDDNGPLSWSTAASDYEFNWNDWTNTNSNAV